MDDRLGSDGRRRILFVAEAVTLAHVARPHVMANALGSESFDVLFASDPRYEGLFGDARYARHPIRSIPSERFFRSLAKGTPLYDFATLRDYVEEDLAVIDAFRPDLIVGDFRLSLSVSARLRSIPYVAISNAYWSPQADLEMLAPELPLTRWLGYRVGGAVFRWGCPIGFAMHARPFHRLWRHYGLSPLGPDVREYYVDGDRVLFADLEQLIPLRERPEHQGFIGPVPWSPEVARPDWWPKIQDRDGPTVYITLGSSGAADALPQVVQAAARFAGTVLVATAGRGTAIPQAGNVFVADYLRGDEAAAVSDVVICNGGSPSTYQALAAGRPVVGIPNNLDQCLNMSAIRDAGCGQLLRVREVSDLRMRAALEAATAPNSVKSASRVAAAIADSQHDWRRSLDSMLPSAVTR